MHIRKWYADCVAPDGTVFIGHAGSIGVGLVRIPVQVALLGERGSRLAQTSAVAKLPSDALGGGRFLWKSPRLALAGDWTANASAFERVLPLGTDDVRVTWRCHLPRAAARVHVGGRSLEGLGYVEELVVDGDPRALPIRELRWGRFLGEREWVVWIDGKGSAAFSSVVRNGSEVAGASVGDDAVRMGDARIPLGSPAHWVLRDEKVEDSLFPSHPALRKLVPRVLAELHEKKWAGRGRLEDPEGAGEEGWLLYDRVVWP